MPPPSHTYGGISGPLALSSPSRSLGTGTLHRVPVAAARHPTFITPPGAPHPAAQEAPVFRAIDEDIPAVPVPPPMTYSRVRRSRALSAHQRSSAMPVIAESPRSTTAPNAPDVVVRPPSSSPSEDFIPIIHKRVPQKINTKAIPPPRPLAAAAAADDDDDDESYTPITSTPSPRDALGIPISKFQLPRRIKSKRTGGESPEDLEPLSPSVDPQGGAGGLLPVPVQAKEKSKRRTVWGLIEGWWDLGLLERGKSLRRK